MRYIILSEEEQKLVHSIEKPINNGVERLRCRLLILSNKKLSMKEISRLTDTNWLRIVRFFNAWNAGKSKQAKLQTLVIKAGTGAKSKLEGVKELIPQLVKEHSHNLNIVLDILEQEYAIKICKKTLQVFLKAERL